MSKLTDNLHLRTGFLGILVVLVSTFLVMLGYEVLKEFCAPQLTKWQSHWITICLTTTASTLGAAYTWRLQRRADRRNSLVRQGERHRTERALQRVHEENANILAAVGSLLITVDASGWITKWNRAAEEFLGIPADKAASKRLADLAIPWDGAGLQDRIRDCLSAWQPVKLDDWAFRLANGQPGHLSISLTPVFGGEQSSPGVLILGTDITERRQLEAQLGQAQKLEAIGRLAAGIAHEINTPVQYIGDNISFLATAFADLQAVVAGQGQALARAKLGTLDEAALAELERTVAAADLEYLGLEMPKAIEQANQGVNQVVQIVRAMKELSHPGNLTKTAVDLNKLVANTITVARNEWKYVAEVVTDFGGDLPPVPCLAGELSQVMVNLLVNAAHAVGDRIQQVPGHKGKIVVSARAFADRVEIRIGDNGAGIPEAVRSRIFEPFFTTKPAGKGTGQGLALAHNTVVKKHGGTLAFETEVGRGTTFVIGLPLTDSANDSQGAQPEQRQPNVRSPAREQAGVASC